MKTNPECRARKGIELREATDAEKADGIIFALEGFIPFNSDSAELRDWGLNSGKPFVEQISTGAFKRSLAEDKDIMGFAGHTDDPLSAFARIGKNLTVTTDERGMSWRALAPDTQAMRDLRNLIKRGVIQGTSFEFNVRGDGQKWEKRDGKDVRIITDARLYTVNPVAFPAYPESELTVSMRSRKGASRRGYYVNQDEDFLWLDGNMTPDTAFGIQALNWALAELTESLDYLRDVPGGAHVAFATAKIAAASKECADLIAWLAANGAKVPEDMSDRAKQRLAEARTVTDGAKKISDATAADREKRRLEAFIIAPLVNA